MGQLARQGRHAAGGGAGPAHHAIRIPISVVWRRVNAAEDVSGGTAVATGLKADKRGAESAYETYYHR